MPQMSQPYEEILEGTSLLRAAPGTRHETICTRLHTAMTAGVANLAITQLLAPRAKVRVSHSTVICPDLALVTAATNKLWLAVEIVNTDDHRADTVIKKQLYEEIRVPRLWMIDPRYDNVEIYHSTGMGMSLQGTLAGKEKLSEKLVPKFQMIITELFAAPDV
ncbi:MAG TPA: Uma2 family endonuclease [Verrucomicrobiae bacterium]|nr:Uma2 family endonuclease [Verrucomicrobiae bacterium]